MYIYISNLYKHITFPSLPICRTHRHIYRHSTQTQNIDTDTDTPTYIYIYRHTRHNPPPPPARFFSFAYRITCMIPAYYTIYCMVPTQGGIPTIQVRCVYPPYLDDLPQVPSMHVQRCLFILYTQSKVIEEIRCIWYMVYGIQRGLHTNYGSDCNLLYCTSRVYQYV